MEKLEFNGWNIIVESGARVIDSGMDTRLWRITLEVYAPGELGQWFVKTGIRYTAYCTDKAEPWDSRVVDLPPEQVNFMGSPTAATSEYDKIIAEAWKVSINK